MFTVRVHVVRCVHVDQQWRVGELGVAYVRVENRITVGKAPADSSQTFKKVSGIIITSE